LGRLHSNISDNFILQLSQNRLAIHTALSGFVGFLLIIYIMTFSPLLWMLMAILAGTNIG